MGVTSYITHVRYSGTPRVISHVKHAPTGAVKTRAEVVSDIARGVTYVTLPPGGGGATVHVVNGKFLSTNHDEKTSDNLENLPEF
jgi:hypothetical protein